MFGDLGGVFRARGRRHLGAEDRAVDVDGAGDGGVLVPLPGINIDVPGPGRRQHFSRRLVGGDDPRLGPQLGGHVGQRHALVHGHGADGGASVFNDHVIGAHDADVAAEFQDKVLGRDPVG